MTPDPHRETERAGAEYLWLVVNGYNYKDLATKKTVAKKCKAYVDEVMREWDEIHG